MTSSGEIQILHTCVLLLDATLCQISAIFVNPFVSYKNSPYITVFLKNCKIRNEAISYDDVIRWNSNFAHLFNILRCYFVPNFNSIRCLLPEILWNDELSTGCGTLQKWIKSINTCKSWWRHQIETKFLPDLHNIIIMQCAKFHLIKIIRHWDISIFRILQICIIRTVLVREIQ